MVLQNSWNNTLVAPLKVVLGTDAQGDLYYRDASGNLARLAIGTSGQALVSGGTLPSWGNPTPGGNAGGDLTGTFPNPAIAANAVTFAKVQNISTATILGRTTAATGVIEQLTATQARTVMGLGTAAVLNTGTASGNIPILDASGKLDSATIPAIAVHNFVQVANTAARLALTTAQVQPGDEAFELDTLRTYKLIATDPTLTASWVLISDASIDGSEIVSGTIAPARLGTGTPTASNYLRGDGTWATVAGGSGLSWSEITATTATMAANNGYFANNAALVTLTLPTTAAVGSIIRVAGVGAGGWRVAQNASQQIHYLNKSTTVGVAGRIDAEITNTQSARASLELVCLTANTTWVTTSGVGTVDIV